MSNNDPLQLSQQIISRIENLVDGNQASKADVQAISSKTENFIITVHFDWSFDEEIVDDVSAGGNISDIDFGKNKVTFTRQTEKFIEQLKNDDDSRARTVKDLALYRDIHDLEEKIVYHSFEPFSVTENCDDCRGRGRTKCIECNGKGTKGIGKERRTCGHCDGKGTIECPECSGYGYFVRTRKVNGIAKSSWSVLVSNEDVYGEKQQWHSRLQDYLKGDLGFITRNIDLELDEDSISEHSFFYKGESCWIEQIFKVKDKEYKCTAFANPPFIYDRPDIFDDLFEDELRYLDENIGNKTTVTNKEGFEFFNRYSYQPVLTQVMKSIGEGNDNEEAVLKACRRFVSHSTAKKMGGYLKKIMNAASPKYARKTWATMQWLAALLIFVLVGTIAETTISDSLFSTIFSQMLNGLIVSAVFGIIAAICSSILVSSVRKKIPKEFHQKTENTERFIGMVAVNFFVVILALIYAFAVTKDWVPSWNKSSLNYVSKPICQTLNTYNSYLVCPDVLKEE